MSTESRITESLAALPFKLFPDFYDCSKTYIRNGQKIPQLEEWGCYRILNSKAAIYADDEEIVTETTASIHFFSKSRAKATAICKRIRQALRSAGFAVQTHSINYESDTEYYHAQIEINDFKEAEE